MRDAFVATLHGWTRRNGDRWISCDLGSMSRDLLVFGLGELIERQYRRERGSPGAGRASPAGARACRAALRPPQRRARSRARSGGAALGPRLASRDPPALGGGARDPVAVSARAAEPARRPRADGDLAVDRGG